MLKTSKHILLIVMVFIGSTAFTGLDIRDDHPDINKAFSQGDAELLRTVMSSSVEIELPSEMEGIYSKAQTIVILNKFFAKNPPKSFDLNHSGQSASSSKFLVGKYLSTNGNEYRVTLFMKKSGDKYFIQEIELEQE